MPRSKSSKQKVAQLLDAIPLTQTEIANLLNVSQGLVSQWKTGRTLIGDENLKDLTRLASNARSEADDEEQVDSDTRLGSQPYGEWLAEQLDTLNVSQLKLANAANVNALTISNLTTGKTENPQNDTRQKIEEALRSFYPKQKKPRQPAPTPNPKEPTVGILFKKEEIEQAPNACGVYVIHDKRGWPTYVGKGSLRSELHHHYTKKWATDFSAHKFSYAPVDDQKDADKIETILIKFMADSLLVNKKKRVSVAEAS